MRSVRSDVGWLFGFRVSTHTLNAPQRNRIKRLLREAVGRQRGLWQSSEVRISLILEPQRWVTSRVRLDTFAIDVERIIVTLANEFSDL